MQNVLRNYGFLLNDSVIRPLGNGLINSTWLIETAGKKFVLQKINQHVFKNPQDIAININLVGSYLKTTHPDYLFTAAVKTTNGDELVIDDGAYYRLFDFVKNSHTIDAVKTPDQAFEASRQFAKFSKMLVGFDATKLKITLPDFHNLTLRYLQFETAVKEGNKKRIDESEALINAIKNNRYIVNEFEECKSFLKIRCTHHDTKISNVLFGDDNKGICVIDLDTVMPGYFISDVGDMMRTYLCPVTEEEKEISKIIVRKEFYKAIKNGYFSEMADELSAEEKKYFHYSGEFIIYMQAIRFLTDYLNNDVYYGAKYGTHNFVRASNQLALLTQYQQLQ